MDFLPYVPGLMLLLGQLLVFVAHIISDRTAVAAASSLLEHPIAPSGPQS